MGNSSTPFFFFIINDESYEPVIEDGKIIGFKKKKDGADTVIPFNSGLDTFIYSYDGYITPNNLNGGTQNVSFPISGYKTMEIRVTNYSSRNNYGSVTISGVGNYIITGSDPYLVNGVKNISTNPATVNICTYAPYNHELTVAYSLIFRK